MSNLEKESSILYRVLEINSFFFHFKEIWLFSMPPMAADSKQVMGFSINAENKGSCCVGKTYNLISPYLRCSKSVYSLGLYEFLRPFFLWWTEY